MTGIWFALQKNLSNSTSGRKIGAQREVFTEGNYAYRYVLGHPFTYPDTVGEIFPGPPWPISDTFWLQIFPKRSGSFLNGNLPKLSYESTKIEGSPTFRALKKNISVRFFFQKIFLKSGLIIASISATLDLQRTNLYLGTLLFIKMCTYTTFYLEPPSYDFSKISGMLDRL